MATSEYSSPRDSPKRSHVTEELRTQIVQGDFPPGTRLPKRSELRERYGISHVTIQRALDELIRDGFVYTRGRGGTFVSKKPPHLYHYGLLMHSGCTPYVEALKHEAALLAEARGITWRFYDEDQITPLEQDAHEHRLAGVILAYPTLLDTPPHLPSLLIDPQAAPCGKSTLVMDFQSLANRGMERLNELNIQHVTALTSDSDPHGQVVSALKKSAVAHGLSMPNFRVQYLCPKAAAWAGGLIELLMINSSPKNHEALFVTNDQLLPAVLESIGRLPIESRHRLTVLTYANYRSDQEMIPDVDGLARVIRLGFDTGLSLRTALAHLEAQRVDKQPPRRVDLPVLFEEEVGQYEMVEFTSAVFGSA